MSEVKHLLSQEALDTLEERRAEQRRLAALEQAGEDIEDDDEDLDDEDGIEDALEAAADDGAADDEDDSDSFADDDGDEAAAPTRAPCSTCDAPPEPSHAPDLAKGELAPLRPEVDRDGYPYNYPRPRLSDVPFTPKKRRPATSETETLLNGLIVECGDLMRDVAFRSACEVPDVGARLRFLSAAESLALTATKVSDAIARLKHGEPQVVDSHRHELVYTHVHTSPLPSQPQT